MLIKHAHLYFVVVIVFVLFCFVLWIQKLIEASLRQQKKLQSMSVHVPERTTFSNSEINNRRYWCFYAYITSLRV
jgi:Na+/phosphate symporter